MQGKLTHAQLAKMSGMSRERIAEFMTVWPALPHTERRRVVRALVQMAEDNVEHDFNDLFLRFLEDDDAEVRAAAVEGLWEDERPSTADALMRLVRADADEAVRGTAMKALARFALRIALGDLSGALVARLRQVILEHVTPETPLAVRRRAIEAAGYLPDEAEVADLIRQAYRSDNPALRASAVRAMGFTCDVTWLNTVLREMESEDPEMRYEATQAAGQIEDERAVPRLIEATRDEDAEVRLAAVIALGQIGGQAARDTLHRLVRSDDPALSEAADAALEDLAVGTDPLGVRVHDINPN